MRGSGHRSDAATRAPGKRFNSSLAPLSFLFLLGSMGEYGTVILLTFVGFVALAAILLVPVYRFLKREEKLSQRWTPEALARRAHQQPNGAPPEPPESPSPAP